MRFLPIGDGLAHHQIFELDLRIAVLAFLIRLKTIRCEGLLRAGMHTSETHGTLVSNGGNMTTIAPYILHRAHFGTYAATRTLVGIHLRSHTMNHASRHSRTAEEP